MNQKEFMKKLQKKLKGMPVEERDEAIRYYKEYFLDAGLDDKADVVPLVGTPDEVARRIISECTDKTLKSQKEDGGVGSNIKLVWLLILGALAAPVGLPILIVIFALIFTMFAVVMGLTVGLFAVSVSVVIGFIAMIPGVFWAASLGQSMLILGLSLIGISVGIALSVAIAKLIGLVIRGSILIIRKLFGRKKA